MATIYDTHRAYWLKKSCISQPFQELLEKHIIPGTKVLDLGCGGGRLSIALAEANCVYGLDFSAEMISDLRIQHPHIKWQCGNAEDYSTWCEFPEFAFIVSNVCIRKDQCRLDKVMEHINQLQTCPTLLFRIQGSKDLPGFVEKSPCYSEQEILSALKGWHCEIQQETFQQRFTSEEYLRSSVERIGLKPPPKRLLKGELRVQRHYLLVKAEKK